MALISCDSASPPFPPHVMLCYAVLLPCNVMASKLSIDPVSSLKCCVIYLLLQITRHASEPLIAVGQEGSICLLLYLSRTVHAITWIIWPAVRFRSHYLLSNDSLLAEEWGLRTHHAMSAWVQAAVHHCCHMFSVQGYVVQPCSRAQTSECAAKAGSGGILCYFDLWILIWDQAEHTCWHTRLSQHTVISLHSSRFAVMEQRLIYASWIMYLFEKPKA